jgi:acetyl esterase/lipase
MAALMKRKQQHNWILALMLIGSPAWAAVPDAALHQNATLHVNAPPGLCAKARIDNQEVSRDTSGAFPAVVLTSSSADVQCKHHYTLAIPKSSNATIHLTLDAEGRAHFSGANAELNSLLNTPLRLTMRALYPLLRGDEQALRTERKRLHDADLTRLTQLAQLSLSATLLAREKARTDFNHAQVRSMLPFFRWRESQQLQLIDDPELPAIINALPLREPHWWSLPEFDAFAGAWIHETARRLLGTSAPLRTGDHRWLRAGLAAIEQNFPDDALKQRLRDQLVLKHVDEDGSAGMEAILAAWRDTANSEAKAKVDAKIADEPDAKAHTSFVYQTLSGTDLRVYVMKPAQTHQTPMPASLWFHGGSSTEGAWWHMPVIPKALREQGVVVIGVDLSTHNRFDRDADQLRDADLAWQWLKKHATELQLDTQRLGVAGFSSGASLALTTATRGLDTGDEKRELPAMAIVMGACADPLANEEDGWFRKSMAHRGDPALFTPMGNIREHLPPVLAIHGTADEYCSYTTLEKFAEQSRAKGNRVVVTGIDGASHFFGFYHRPGIAAARASIVEQLRNWQWSPQEPENTP